MSRSLLDVNVLVALLDQQHIDHDRAREWLEVAVRDGWATCPITENGFVRIVSQPRYTNPVAPSLAVELLAGACGSPAHEFWADDVSVLDPAVIDASRLHGPRQVTDAYLLALAAARGGRFATFDRTVSLAAVPAATADNLLVI